MSALAPVCILTAGQGTRMGPFGQQINKALLPLDNRAIITHIIEKFSADTEFVIGVGYHGEQVRQYLGIAHPTGKFTFVTVDNYAGPGSGPGYSLLCCKPHLQRPFYFVSCDTLWSDPLPHPGDESWLGVAPVRPEETSRYCMLRVEHGQITDLIDKQRIDDDSYEAFVGLCYIYDFSLFWHSFENAEIAAGERQVSNGIKGLIRESRVWSQSINWTDVGNLEQYKAAVGELSDYDFSKTNEFFYAVGNKIIKFFVDTDVSRRRVEKAALKPEAFPRITDHAGGFYAYEFRPGKTLYERNDPGTFQSFLLWMERCVWTSADVTPDVMTVACRSFYRDKTRQRLRAYEEKYPASEPAVVNGQTVPSAAALLERVPWTEVEQGIPFFIHGDLQFDNILHDESNGRFTLLDWRQDFAGHLAFGDLYYDLAKLRGGIILNYDFIKRNLLSYNQKGDRASFDFAQRHLSTAYLLVLDDYIVRRGLHLDRVRLLVALIYLNMSPLHHYPFDRLLHALGRVQLSAELDAVR